MLCFIFFLRVDSLSLLSLVVVVRFFLIWHICFYLCFFFPFATLSGCLILHLFPTVLLQHFFFLLCFKCSQSPLPTLSCPFRLSSHNCVFFPPSYFCLFFRLFLYPPSNPAPLQVRGDAIMLATSFPSPNYGRAALAGELPVE